ncbi:hypothetical protein SCALM49S_08231 [Streptomyces californicus]
MDSANRARQPSVIAGIVRVHRSASPASTGFSGSGSAAPRSIGMKAGSRSRYRLAPSRSGRALEQFQEVVVEEEDPHVPVGDQAQRLGRAVGMGVRAQEGVVVRLQVLLLPDTGPLQHSHGAGPLPGVRACCLQVRVQPGRITGRRSPAVRRAVPCASGLSRSLRAGERAERRCRRSTTLRPYGARTAAISHMIALRRRVLGRRVAGAAGAARGGSVGRVDVVDRAVPVGGVVRGGRDVGDRVGQLLRGVPLTW